MEKLGPSDPQHIGAYRLLTRLGAGGMGHVYLARSDRGRTVAVKLVRQELAQQEEFRDRFRQEVRAARRVGGQWTAPVLDADTEAAIPWVATGYVAGPTLQTVVGHDHGALPERSVGILAAGLAHALQDIHSAGLVHRDLKPSNVLVTIDGPRVIDFGIARALETVTDGGLTRTGALVGSPGFMAPEQVRGDRITPACDVFCLGSVLAYAASGTLPFGTANSGVHALMFRIAQEQPNLEGVPESLAELVADCLRKDPAARPTLDDILRRTGAEDTVIDGRSREPWLPGALVAQLGRHAVQLLDTENPAEPEAPEAAGTGGGAAAAVSGTPGGMAVQAAGAAGGAALAGPHGQAPAGVAAGKAGQSAGERGTAPKQPQAAEGSARHGASDGSVAPVAQNGQPSPVAPGGPDAAQGADVPGGPHGPGAPGAPQEQSAHQRSAPGRPPFDRLPTMVAKDTSAPPPNQPPNPDVPGAPTGPSGAQSGGAAPGYPGAPAAQPAPGAAYGYPHAHPNPAAYSYPQQGPYGSTPPYGPDAPSYGPAGMAPPRGPGGQHAPPWADLQARYMSGPPPGLEPEPARGSRATVVLVLVALLVALGAGGAVWAFMKDRDDTTAHGDKTSPAPSTPGPSPSDASNTGGAQVSESPSVEDGTVPTAFLGTWEGSIDTAAGHSTRRLVIQQGKVGDTVLSLTAEGPTDNGTYHCVFQATLESASGGDGPLRIGPSVVTVGEPVSSCSPGAATTVTLLPDGRLERTNNDSGEKLTYTKTG